MSGVVDFPVKPEARPYLEAFGRGDFIRDRREPDWLVGYRKASLARFAELGFPSRRSEAWRYIDLRPLEQRPMLPATTEPVVVGAPIHKQLAEIGLAGPTYRLVLIDGRFAPELSELQGLPHGVWFGSTSAAIEKRTDFVRPRLEASTPDGVRPFAAVNGAFFADGFVLDIPSGMTIERPVEILHLSCDSNGGSLHTRSLVTAGEGSRASVVESFTGIGEYWRNDVVELQLAAEAELTRVVLVEEAAEALHFGEMLATLGVASRLSSFALLLGGRTVRHETTVCSTGERS